MVFWNIPVGLTKMGEYEQRICRLCLKMLRHDFQAVDRVARRMLDVLLIKTDFSLSADPVMCANCAKSLRECFEFKSTCLFTEDRVVHFANGIDNTRVDILQLDHINNSTFTSSNIICRFCMRCIDQADCIALGTLDGDFYKEDLTVTESATICTTCMESLIRYHRFMTSCLSVEKDVSAYRQLRLIDDGMVNLSNVYRFVLRDILGQDEASNSIVKENLAPIVETEIKTGNTRRCTKSTSDPFIGIKWEDFVDVFDTGQEECVAVENADSVKGASNMMILIAGLTRDDDEPSERRNASNVVRLTKKDANSTENFINKGDVTESIYKSLPSESTTSLKSTRGILCPKGKDCLRDISNSACREVRVKKSCFRYTDEIEVENIAINNHIVPQDNILSFIAPLDHSDECTYTITNENFLTQPKQYVRLYKCNTCSYVAVQKRSVINHTNRKHFPPDERTMLKCPSCAYQTCSAYSMRQHKIMHKSPEDIQMYRCDKCSYRSKWKQNLTSHKLSHQPEHEGVFYYCASCQYKTRLKHNLHTHMLVHQNLKLQKCEKCSFRTNYRINLKKHYLVHKRWEESVTYQCLECSYRTKSKYYFKRHLFKALKHLRRKHVTANAY